MTICNLNYLRKSTFCNDTAFPVDTRNSLCTDDLVRILFLWIGFSSSSFTPSHSMGFSEPDGCFRKTRLRRSEYGQKSYDRDPRRCFRSDRETHDPLGVRHTEMLPRRQGLSQVGYIVFGIDSGSTWGISCFVDQIAFQLGIHSPEGDCELRIRALLHPV